MLIAKLKFGKESFVTLSLISKNLNSNILRTVNDWSRILVQFPDMSPGLKRFFDLSMLDIQEESKGYSICQIEQNNDLPKRVRIFYTYLQLLLAG